MTIFRNSILCGTEYCCPWRKSHLMTHWKKKYRADSTKWDFWRQKWIFWEEWRGQDQGTKQRVQRILGDCWHWETNGQCVKGNNCSSRHDMSKRGKSSPSNPSQNSFMQQSERKPSRTRRPRGKNPSGRMSRWPCKDYLILQKMASSWMLVLQEWLSVWRKVLMCAPSSWWTADWKVQKEWWRKCSGFFKKGGTKEVTIDQGNLTRGVIKSWYKNLLNVNYLMHDNWVAYFRTWRRRSLFFGRALTCRKRSSL